uniref:Sodium/proline symporter n=1 Tax=Candidatus Kentrum sp. DK TaxID=2126562 RepID=A0A450T6L6_9GAMM|nr:MAG: sodium/proline symporter [Candidatus Kentron sp. DK]VFJ67347.1 MAG: sodium/proline symporter [Candidatus Kentron sp. DK]
MILTSFILFMIVFLLIGVTSVYWSKNTVDDYLIAGKSVPPSLVGLSAIATNNSGFMFVGMIGFTYLWGLSSIWMMVGWILGDMTASLLTVRRIKQVSKAENIHSFGGLLSHWHGTDYKTLRVVTGVLTVLFLTVYAAAQLKAGSKATASLLGWEMSTGVFLSAGIVLIYSMAGGIRASIWTDVAQSIVMIIGMSVLVVMGLRAAGGMEMALMQLATVSPDYMNWSPAKDTGLQVALFIAGWFFGGVPIGQPHIVIRFMSLNDEKNINRMRVYYYGWYILFYGATIIVGLLSRFVLSGAGNSFDAELALPNMASELLPPAFVGLILAAMFAATMSTADSLILACSASVTRDIHQNERHSLWVTKLATLSILVVAVLIALSGNRTVFSLVMDAWGMLSSAFAPLVVLYSLGRRISEPLALMMIFVGLATFAVWNLAGMSSVIYSAAPGIVSGFIVYLVAWGINRLRQPVG